MFSRESFTAGASSRSRSSNARALRTAAALNASSSLTQIWPPKPRSFPAEGSCCPTLLGPELPSAAMTLNPARGRITEVTADYPHLRIREALDELPPGKRGLRLVHVEVGLSRWIGELNG